MMRDENHHINIHLEVMTRVEKTIVSVGIMQPHTINPNAESLIVIIDLVVGNDSLTPRSPPRSERYQGKEYYPPDDYSRPRVDDGIYVYYLISYKIQYSCRIYRRT
ncbi:hypothetical protein RF11_04147 [Thelohanellus kitauei]|uniref:Uncharacterized protein n=1 Tax=Thelohanellus kitauei TaxID=669202 RepID=A0A0C2J865_THEKT|nr:hypothetical protein RF11_04147 [Thelohanellus kitauei]